MKGVFTLDAGGQKTFAVQKARKGLREAQGKMFTNLDMAGNESKLAALRAYAKTIIGAKLQALKAVGAPAAKFAGLNDVNLKARMALLAIYVRRFAFLFSFPRNQGGRFWSWLMPQPTILEVTVP